MSNKLILWTIFLIVGIGLIISANIFRDTDPRPVVSNPGATTEPANSPEPRTTPRPTAEPGQASFSPASCQISGEIVFLSGNIYENKGAKIVYQNVDDNIRQIYWKSNPDDGVLVIGPNLFEDLSIPNGERDIGVAFAKEPTDKNYTLAASITYGAKQQNGNIKESVANCSGKINVDVSNI